MRLLFDNSVFIHDPYPIGIAKPIFDEDGYNQLVMGFPPDHLLPAFGSHQGYKKFALNERMPGFHEYLTKEPAWWAFHNSIKSQKFIQFILALIKDCGAEIVENPSGKWTSRFEFAAMPADGGMIAPHTDIPSKAVTLIFSMQAPEEWDPAWGGGTDVLVPRQPLDPQITYKSYMAPLSAFDRVHSYEYTPNQCVIFVKNDISWHSVGPMTGPPGPMRRTITLNIERPG